MHDVIFAGGGLASCLSAWRLRQLRPELDILVVEGAPTVGGNHTWSFFPTDLSQAQLDWIEPLILHRWPSYEVRFPDRRRTLTTGYCSTNSEHFHALMTAELGSSLRMNTAINIVDPHKLVLASGETLRARNVVDGRGPASSPHLKLGFQKFTGLVLELNADHDLAGPIIMDATVAQNGDYRFLYTLPIGSRELLVEDTRYSNSPALDGVVDAGTIGAYAREQGWSVTAVLRQEQGALPITLGGDIERFWDDAAGVPRIGLRGALFHATTGYSFADAVRTADAIAAADISTTESLYDLLMTRSRHHWQSQAYWRLLNRMLFIAAEPDRRWFVMQRFYGLGQSLIERFYAGRSTPFDKVRILTGKPPVAILRALRCLPENSAIAFTNEVEDS